MFKQMIKKSIYKSQHCNRNWDLSKSIPQEDIETIITAVTQCSSKQNLDFYSVYAIQDRNMIEDIYESTVTEKGRKNPQVLAHLLLVFVENSKVALKHPDTWDRNGEIKDLRNTTPTKKETIQLLNDDLHESIGVAAGTANIVSAMLGYETGCCKCFDNNKLDKMFDEPPLLMMGIGIRDKSRNRREEHKEGFLIDTFKKIPIKESYI